MDDVPAVEPSEPEAEDFSDALDQLAVVEAELAAAEAELEELEAPAHDPDAATTP